MSGAEATAAATMEKNMGLDFWRQLTGFDFDAHVKKAKEKAFMPLPIDPEPAASLRPFNGFYNFIFVGGGPQFPISPYPGPIMPGPLIGKGFMMIDRSVDYSPSPSHKICVSFKADIPKAAVEDITKQIIKGGFDPKTNTVNWTYTVTIPDFGSKTLHGRAMFTDLALSACSSTVSSALGMFAEMSLAGFNQVAPAGLDVFVGNYQYVLGGAPPCTFNITKSGDGFKVNCTIKQQAGNEKEIHDVEFEAPTISYNAQMYLLTVRGVPGLRMLTAMLGTYSNVGLVAYVMGIKDDYSSANGFIGINKKPDGPDEGDRLHRSVLGSRMLIHSAVEGAKKKAKKVETAYPPTGVPVSREIANAMHPFNGFYSLTGNDVSDDNTNWLCIDRQVTYYSKSHDQQRGVPQYTVQVTYQINGSSVQDISKEATDNFSLLTNTIKFGQTELKFSTQPLSISQTAVSQCEGQIQTPGRLVQVTGTNSLAAPDISMYAGNYSHILMPPVPSTSKGTSFSLNLYYIEGAYEISITKFLPNEKTGKSAVVPQFTYDPAMFTVDIPAYTKADIPQMMVMLGTVAPLGCVAYIIIKGKNKSITFISTNQ